MAQSQQISETHDPPPPPPKEWLQHDMAEITHGKNNKPEQAGRFVAETQEIKKPSDIQERNFLDNTIENLRKTLKISKKQKNTTVPDVKDALVMKVEHIMEDGLHDAFMEMTPVQQQEFKIKGEQTAIQIRRLLKSAHIKIKQIFKLIIEWLKMLPGVNKFFIEQEAKIKADRIIALKK
jgi:glutamyl/glutaminyl-tRNA synthetase